MSAPRKDPELAIGYGLAACFVLIIAGILLGCVNPLGFSLAAIGAGLVCAIQSCSGKKGGGDDW